MGFVCARLIMLLADPRPYMGWYWPLAVAGGVVVAIALPWALVRAARGQARWAAWPMLGYTALVVGGMRYFLSLRFTPPVSVSGGASGVLPPPPLWLVLEVGGLSAVAVTIAAITALILAVTVEVLAPGPMRRWLRALRARRRP
jgi:hypothetical protein